jgi:hypothetical protein
VNGCAGVRRAVCRRRQCAGEGRVQEKAEGREDVPEGESRSRSMPGSGQCLMKDEELTYLETVSMCRRARGMRTLGVILEGRRILECGQCPSP